MEKFLNIIGALGLIVLLMAMPLFYTVIFMGSFFLDVTPVANVDFDEVDHGATKIWEGMPKDEYEKIMYLEEHKY
ncbi:hypothetical protein [Peribacillus frigoritolerans]|uniref:hypothetical protein n=1 Tax=Peribacillus frigoritolerans TaxID=450367 RepID=UPI00384C9D1B